MLIGPFLGGNCLDLTKFGLRGREVNGGEKGETSRALWTGTGSRYAGRIVVFLKLSAFSLVF